MELSTRRKPSRNVSIVTFITVLVIVGIAYDDVPFVLPSVTGYSLPTHLSSCHQTPATPHINHHQPLHGSGMIHSHNRGVQDIAYSTFRLQLSSSSRRTFRIQYSRTTPRSTSLSASTSGDNSHSTSSLTTKRSGAEFEYQEMKVILDVLQREGIVASNRMDRNKAQEMNSYLQRIVSDRKSITTADSKIPSWQQQQQVLQSFYNTSWTMQYTTMEILPPDSTIQLQFSDVRSTTNTIRLVEQRQPVGTTTTTTTATIPMAATPPRTMKYRLIFGPKVLGLNSLNVDGDWVMYDTDDPLNPTLGLSFDTITMDAFGFHNIPLCFLSNILLPNHNDNKNDNPNIFIQSVYIDDRIWIEQQQMQSDTNDINSSVIWNVYRKDEDDERIR